MSKSCMYQHCFCNLRKIPIKRNVTAIDVSIDRILLKNMQNSRDSVVLKAQNADVLITISVLCLRNFLNDM